MTICTVSLKKYFKKEKMSLKDIYLPESIKMIGEEAFLNCGRLTILTPAGSFGHRYAKEHNIKVLTL